MPRIWFERPVPAKFLNLLDGQATVAGPASATPDQPLSALPGAQVAIVGSRIRFDGAFFDQFPNLRAVIRTGIGYDNVSVPDATARQVAVCNVPSGPTISTAEHAVALMLATVKHLKQGDRDLRRGDIADLFLAFDGLELYGRRLGLIGMGRIGSRVARIAQALEMTVIVYDPYLSPAQAAAAGVELASSLEAVLAVADVVSIHAPYSAETHHLFNAERLAQMKPGAYLVNAARGGLVDEAALLSALESGHLAGAGLDVFDPEPPPTNHPLLQRADVIASGHVAGATQASKDRLIEGAIQQAVAILGGEQPPFLLNPEIWPPAGPRWS
jgi:D-3-phosphoglycerate dehydrogenase / 2-oxoglutarate reductase